MIVDQIIMDKYTRDEFSIAEYKRRDFINEIIA